MKKGKINPSLTSISYQLVQLLGETTYVRNDVNSIKAKIGAINNKLDSLEAKNEKDHEEIIEAIKEFVGGGYDLLDKRVSKLEAKVFNTL